MKLKNRGALSNPVGRFENHNYEKYEDGWDYQDPFEDIPVLQTFLMPEKAKSIIAYNDSPDIGFDRSINPYRGCEHGCIYCYARPSHGYVNLSSGIDFETKIFHKVDAGKLLEAEINKPKYTPEVIVIGANTDPYQPAEVKLKVTREILEVLARYKHPVGIITKSSLIERDFDILTEMNKDNLVSVAVSITTLKDDLKRILEPRASSPKARLRVIKRLNELNIPNRVMAAPMIPMINDVELDAILKQAAEVGCKHASYILLRLPHEVKDLFREWLNTHFKERANHVMSLVKQMRGGKEYDSTFGTRMRGEGEFASLLEKRFRLACQRLGINQERSVSLNKTAFKKNTGPQMAFDF